MKVTRDHSIPVVLERVRELQKRHPVEADALAWSKLMGVPHQKREAIEAAMPLAERAELARLTARVRETGSRKRFAHGISATDAEEAAVPHLSRFQAAVAAPKVAAMLLARKVEREHGSRGLGILAGAVAGAAGVVATATLLGGALAGAFVIDRQRHTAVYRMRFPANESAAFKSDALARSHILASLLAQIDGL